MVARSNWFGGVYRDPKNFFASSRCRTTISTCTPIPAAGAARRLRARPARRLVGRQLADQFGFKVGDVIPIKGTIYPGTWDFVVRGIMDGRDESTITRQMVFHWDYLNETVRKKHARQADQVGVFVLGVDNPDNGRPSRATSTTCSELAGRDADRNRAGVPAWLCGDVEPDHRRDPWCRS
jgi:putative ABC transport system permease protein